MSRIVMTESSTFVSKQERCFTELPYEILFEVFKGLTKGKLIEISRLCSRFRDVAGDKRSWKDVYIKYKNKNRSYNHSNFRFENLYSEPWPVKVIDLSRTQIISPVSSQTHHQVVKVTKLNLSVMEANKVTMEAILAKYQCTELCLDRKSSEMILEISAEAFAKQPALEVLSLRCLFGPICHQGLTKILSHCKNLKSLDLFDSYIGNLEISGFVKHLPKSLEKLLLPINNLDPEDSFFKLLAESNPKLRDLGLNAKNVKCPSLLKFKFLETLRVIFYNYADISDLCMCIIKFPALKTVYTHMNYGFLPNKKFEQLRKTLEPRGIIVRPIEELEFPSCPADGNLWEVFEL